MQRVVDMLHTLNPDIVTLTGDFVDGTIRDLSGHVAPLGELRPKGRIYFVPGNHEYYSGARAWMDHFQAIGCDNLENSYRIIDHKDTKIVIGGVLHPAARMVDRTLGPPATTHTQ